LSALILHKSIASAKEKAKARAINEFGAKVTVATNLKEGLVVGMGSMPGKPSDGHTLMETGEQASILMDKMRRTVIVGRGYQGVFVEVFRSCGQAKADASRAD